MDILNKLFEEHFHSPVKRVQPLQGELGGSGRKIIRLSNERASAIGILYGVREENAAFLEFSRHFRKHGLPVPEIYGLGFELLQILFSPARGHSLQRARAGK